MSKIIPALAVATFTFLVFFYGACISGLVLREPDICFVLATGKWIVEHGKLPTSDPFSYSTIYHHIPYVLEKWLAEVILYDIWKYTSTAGLLVFAAVIQTITFTIMPYRYLRLSGVAGLNALLLTTLATLVSYSHLNVRPEIFSFLIIAIYLEFLLRRSTADKSLHYPTAICMVALMVLWANLQTLFIVGLMMLGLYTACIVIEQVLKLTPSKIDWTIPLAFLLSVPATLLTPYGVGLWTYLPNIFGGFTKTNNELQPITLSSLSMPFIYPYFVLIVVATVIYVRHALKRPTETGQLFFKVLIPVGIAGGINTIRSILIADLFAFAGIANVLKNQKANLSEIDKKIDELCQPFNPLWLTLTIGISGLGAYAMTSIIPPDIPTKSAAFAPPVAAVKYIGQNLPAGRMLNDPHFGNVLMWQLENAPPVFIDSRYNIFGNTLLQDYWIMADDKPGARQLLNKYAIDWIFLNPKMQLVKTLSQDPQWKVLYQDSDSAIVARKIGTGEK